MYEMFESTLVDNNLGVCIKDSGGKVLKQNELCLKTCGDCLGKVCDVACMALYNKDKSSQWNDWGSRIYENSYVHNAFYDITLLCSDAYMITFLQPLKEKYQEALDYYKSANLTKREREVLSYLIKGGSNTEICNHFSVSKATIKTHINNIYRKVSDIGLELKYLPKKRVLSQNYSRP